MIHWRLASLRSRSFWIDGSATFTIVASRMTMNCARQIRTRMNQGLVECLDIRLQELSGLASPFTVAGASRANDGCPHDISSMSRRTGDDVENGCPR